MCFFDLRAYLNNTEKKTSYLWPVLFLDLKLALRGQRFQDILQGYRKSIDALRDMLAVMSALRQE